MQFRLPFGPPFYKERMGKTCAILDTSKMEEASPGDRLVDPRGHVWAVDFVSYEDAHLRLTLFCSSSSATLIEGEEIQRPGSHLRRGR